MSHFTILVDAHLTQLQVVYYMSDALFDQAQKSKVTAFKPGFRSKHTLKRIILHTTHVANLTCAS